MNLTIGTIHHFLSCAKYRYNAHWHLSFLIFFFFNFFSTRLTARSIEQLILFFQFRNWFTVVHNTKINKHFINALPSHYRLVCNGAIKMFFFYFILWTELNYDHCKYIYARDCKSNVTTQITVTNITCWLFGYRHLYLFISYHDCR